MLKARSGEKLFNKWHFTSFVILIIIKIEKAILRYRIILFNTSAFQKNFFSSLKSNSNRF